jgi:hypothetical protein
MTKDEALNLALEVLELAEDGLAYSKPVDGDKLDAAITAIKQALAAPVQEPAGHFLDFTYADSVGQVYVYDQFTKGQPFYTTPPVAPVQQKPLFADLIAQHPGLAEELKAMDAAPVQEPADTVLRKRIRALLADRIRYSYGEFLEAVDDLVQQPYYTTLPAAQRQWVGLTDEELDEAEIEGGKSYRRWASRIGGQMLMQQDSLQWHVSRAIEAKLKEKNHD